MTISAAFPSSRSSDGTRVPGFARLATCALFVLVLLMVQPVQAQMPSLMDGGSGSPEQGSSDSGSDSGLEGEPTAEELEGLVRTLKDEGARKAFIEDLEALVKAKRASQKKQDEEAAGPALTDRIAELAANQVQKLSDRMAEVLGVMGLAPNLVDWAERQVTVESKRDRLIGIVWRFLVIVGVGMGAQYLFRRLTNPARRRLEAVPPDESMTARAVRFVGRTLILYLSAFAYGAGAYAALLALPMGKPANALLLVGASSFFVAKLILATTRVVLSPGVAGLRLGTFSDETAGYFYIWVRRMVRIFVYAFFLLEAMRVVGLPEAAYTSLLYLVGLALAGFLVVFVLQNRHSVATAIRGAGRRSLTGPRARIAGIWHIAAIAYITAVYLVWLFRLPGGFEFLMIATGWSLAILVGARVLVLILNRGVDRLLHVGAELADRYPGLEARANRYMPVLRGIIRWTVGIIAALLVLDVWGVDTLGWLASPEGGRVLEKLVVIAIILAIAFVVWEALNLLIERYLRRLDDESKSAARARTLLPLARTAVAIVLVVMVTLIVLSELGVNIGPLLAGAGVVGIAIGFGAQKLVQDVITGLFMLIEDTIAVGDVVQFEAGHAGIVEKLTIRTAQLRDLSGNVHVLPFSEVRTVLNMTKEFGYYLMDVGVAYRENVDRVIEVLRELGEDIQKDEEYGQYVVEPIEILGLDRFGDSAVVIRARLKIVPPIKRWYVGREFNRRMKARFDKDGIEIPFPHRTLYFGVDHDGNAPPMFIANAEENAKSAKGDERGGDGGAKKDGGGDSDVPSPGTQT